MNQMLHIIDMNSVLMSDSGPFVGAPTDVINMNVNMLSW